MSIVFFSVQLAAGSTVWVQQWKVLDIRCFPVCPWDYNSIRDWRPAVRTGMKWQRLAGASPWCSLVIVRVMLVDEKTAYTRLVHWLAANVVLAEHNSRCVHVAWGRGRLVLPVPHAVTLPESMLRDQRLAASRGPIYVVYLSFVMYCVAYPLKLLFERSLTWDRSATCRLEI